MKKCSTRHVSEVTAIASEFGNSAKIIVPRSWLGRRVIVFLHSEYISKHSEEQKPFKYAKNMQEQIEVIFGKPCIDFVNSWLMAEKYIDEMGVVPGEHRRFVNMFQSMVIWINAWNTGIACEQEIPPPVYSYLGILKTFFEIDLSDLISKK